jgi:hypothetical protein
MAPLKALVALSGFAAQTPLDGADTAIWLAASPDVEGVAGRFFDKRRERRCPFGDPGAIYELRALVDRQPATGGGGWWPTRRVDHRDAHQGSGSAEKRHRR